MDMNTLKTIQKLCRLGKALCRAAFVLAVIGFLGCAAGLISLQSGSGEIVSRGGGTLHGVLALSAGRSPVSAAAALTGWLIVCAGEAVLARLAERYFKNELKAQTPFTIAGAAEMHRLGVLTIVIPVACALAANIAEGVILGLTQTAGAIAADIYPSAGASVALGVMFIVASLLCRCGAELAAQPEA